jgi:hypothetical protein
MKVESLELFSNCFRQRRDCKGPLCPPVGARRQQTPDQRSNFAHQLLAATPLAVAAGIAISQPCFARESVVAAKEATSEVAFELAECAAYYTIAAAAIDVSLAPGNEKESHASQARIAAIAALHESEQLTSIDVAAARMNFAWRTMIREMDGKSENVSIIARKYGVPCTDRLAAPDRRFAYWLSEKAKLPDPRE